MPVSMPPGLRGSALVSPMAMPAAEPKNVHRRCNRQGKAPRAQPPRRETAEVGSQQEHQAEQKHDPGATCRITIGCRNGLVDGAEHVAGDGGREILPTLDLPEARRLQRDTEGDSEVRDHIRNAMKQ